MGDAKNKYYCISGQIVSVSYDKGFSYVACKNCKKKVLGDKCEKCGEDKGTRVTYIFSVQVSDGTSAVWVHIFGDEGEKLIGRTAEELRMLKEKSDLKQVFDGIKGRVCADTRYER